VNTWATSGPDSAKRRSQRVILNIPITVSGETLQGQFSEKTQTLVINAHGALITLAARVSHGQKLGLKSVTHPETQACTVVFVGPTSEGRTQFGIEFTKPAPNFWQIAFPPQDWSVAASGDSEQQAEKKTKK
jgi:hypothetical protein